uniref:Epsin-2-like isoform X1 n=1 Tax=Saccoglossus kowalevskii TaxID=10224 RepID=A0ABM0GMK6_SACKO|nr:PREDICTED: epsin-2-like isoform X1 [Saccoglossus kowalevskii]
MPIRRQLKNVVNNYTDSQVKVREATSNDPWGPSSSLMTEIADLTYNVVAFSEIMAMLWKRLNDHGKNWRHVYKSLVVLDYIIKTGSERVAQQCKENIFAIQTLKDFQFIDRDGKDQGVNVREKSKQLVSLLKDDERLKQERARALKAKERFAQASSGIGSNSEYGKESTERTGGYQTGGTPDNQNTDPASESATTPPVNPGELEQARPQTTGEEELQLQLALAMSKEEADESDRQKRSDDVRLQMALNESLDEKPEVVSGGGGGGSALLDLTEPLPVRAATMPTSDPWGAVETDVAPVAADPWGSPAVVAPPPAAAPPQPNPWGEPIVSQSPPPPQPPHRVATDPWGSPALPSHRSASPAADIWGSPPVTSNVATSQAAAWGGESSTDPDADFDSIRIGGGIGNNDPFGGPPAASAMPVDNMFDMGSMGVALSSNSQDEKKKSASDFLGENSSLVNLDSLIGPTPQQQVAQPGSTNPFAVNTTSKSTNPFQVQHSASPTLNQMKQPATMPMTAYGSQLPQPMLPAANVPQQQQQSTNPFLF